jgi:beta-lactamase regulating signal transducer with metallopeptidase domain
VTAFLSFPVVAAELALLLRATLLIGVAWVAAAALRKAGASAAARHIAWLLGIAALLALPVLWWWIPALRLEILPAETAAAAVAAVPSSVAAPPAEVPVQAGWSLLLPLAYALGATILLVRLVVGRRMLTRLWRDAGAVREAAWEDLLSRLSSEMGLSRRVELRIARGPAVPMTWGTLAPKVLLPAEASEWPPERRRLVLLHELAHVARRDSFSRSLASLACALYWFHPGAWFAARQMRMEQEHAADDRVLIAGGSAQAYALSLLHLAKGLGARPRFDQAAAMAGMDQLERRLVSITSPARRDRPGTAFLSSSALLGACATLIVAAAVPVSASSTLLGPLPAKRSDMASPVDYAVDSARSEERARERPADGGGSLERPARESAGVSETRPEGPASEARAIAERGPARRDRVIERMSELTSQGEAASRDRPQSPVSAEPLRDYGWELRARDARALIGTPTASPRPPRLTLPPSLYADSSERTGRPKWARNGPRLVREVSRTATPIPTSQGTLMLEWSVDVGGR